MRQSLSRKSVQCYVKTPHRLRRFSHSLPAVNDRDTCRRLARHMNRSAASIRCFRARNPAFKELVRAIAANGHATDPLEVGERGGGGGGDRERVGRRRRQVRSPPSLTASDPPTSVC